jgi:hypothetical protein
MKEGASTLCDDIHATAFTRTPGFTLFYRQASHDGFALACLR